LGSGFDFVPPGSKGHIDFWEQFPYDPDKAKALLKEAGDGERNPLRYSIMTHGVEAALPTVATINRDDKQVDALIDRMKEAGTEEPFLQAGHDFQQYVVENMPAATGTSLPLLQAARTSVKGYEHLHGFKIRFETTWLDEP
jgi:hypothetical protein